MMLSSASHLLKTGKQDWEATLLVRSDSIPAKVEGKNGMIGKRLTPEIRTN
jgi:hypothetical protein